jgi:hypothetical protein
MKFQKLFFLFLLFQSSLSFCSPNLESDSKNKAFKDLGQYYDNGTIPPFEKAFNDMKSDNDSVRYYSAGYIYALCVQSREDENNGRSEWTRTPFFYETWESKAHIFRKRLASYYGENANSVELIKTAKWLVLNDHEKDNKIQGLRVIKRIKCPETDVFLGLLISNPHLNEEITINVIEEIASRKLLQFAPKIDSLQNHYRSKIRETIYANASKLNISRKNFDLTKAVTPWVEQQFELINTLILDKVPEKASFVSIRIDIPDSNDNTRRPEYTGWIIDKNNTYYSLLDYSAQKISIEKKYSTVRPLSLKEEATNLLKAGRFDGRRRRGGEIRPHSGYEILPMYTMAAWCFNKNLKDEAISIIFNLINNTPDDSTFTFQVVDLFGSLYYNELLYAFSQERDYSKSILLSSHLARPEFKGFRYRNEAMQLGDQLINRSADFATLRLPSITGWDSLKTKLSRTEQIKYLTNRLKLLNCIQNSQPGGISYSSTQYSVPIASLSKSIQVLSNFPSGDAEQELKAFEVINPYEELIKMKLKPVEIKIIAPYLADPDYILAYSFHRDFLSQRLLFKVNWVVSDIILKSVGIEFVDLKDFETLDNYSKQTEILKIIKWCDENSNKTEMELALNVLEGTNKWPEFEIAMNKCAELKCDKATPVLIRRINDFHGQNWPSKSAQIAKSIFEIGSTDDIDKEKIEELQADKDLWIKLWSSLYIIKYDKQKLAGGLSTLKVVLDSCDGRTWYPDAIETLINTQDPKAFMLAEGILDKRGFLEMFDWDYYSEIIKKLFLAGSDKAFLFLKGGLNNTNPDPKYSWSNSNEILTCDRYIVVVNKWKNTEISNQNNRSVSESKNMGKNLTEWLDKQFKIIKSGQVSDIKSIVVNRPVSRIDAPGY